MHTRVLDRGLEASAIGYGCMGLTAGRREYSLWWRRPEADVLPIGL
jgi:aryl-alcohol dehydrogenase-like predicted oxidoreductase